MALTYQKRNLDNIAKLADNTKAAALKWHDYLVANNINILIYETIRTVEQQRQNVANGASQTMKSYHLVGQALDFVPVVNGDCVWNGYGRADCQKAIAYAKSLGFEWGGDWKGFVDKPHLQFNFKGYGTDTFGQSVSQPTPSTTLLKLGSNGDAVKKYQQDIIKAGEKLPRFGADGDFGKETEDATKAFQARHGLTADGIAGSKTLAKLAELLVPKQQPVPVAPKDIVPYPGQLIKQGSRGKDVERIQRAVGVNPDGIFGPNTKSAVVAYQKRHGLAADGIVGSATWSMMF